MAFAFCLALAFTGCRRSGNNTTDSAATNAVPAAKMAGGKTNVTNVASRLPGAKTPAPNMSPSPVRQQIIHTNIAGVARPPFRTNALSPMARAGSATNGAAAVTSAAKTGGLGDKFHSFLNSTWFYPVVAILAIGLSFGGIYLYQTLTAKSAKGGPAAATPETSSGPVSRPIVKKSRLAPVASCNVLHLDPEHRHLWQFSTRGRGFILSRQHAIPGTEKLPDRVISKDFSSIWKRKLNIAWLPADQVFLRVAQVPSSDFTETVSMIELQLEKLSPMPVTQVVWSVQVLHHGEGNMQTVIVMIVARSVVEEFLGKLEGQGFLADRLELPRLDQLLATTPTGDGAWIFPETTGTRSNALIAWWYNSNLQSLALINLPIANAAEGLKEQLVQLAWAGELEGWLTSAPSWHLVADSVTATEWEPPLRAAIEQPIEVISALTLPELAARTATRAVKTEPQANLLPAEFSARYHQQFVDRLWMRGLGAVVGLYVVGVLLYFGRLQIENFRVGRVDDQIAQVGPIYTNAMQLKAKYQILRDRKDLTWAALDCWKNIAELLPDGFTLEGFNLTDGKRLALNGTAPLGQEKRLLDFDSDLRKVKGRDNLPMFDPNSGDHVTYHRMTGDVVSWSCVLELKRSEEL